MPAGFGKSRRAALNETRIRQKRTRCPVRPLTLPRACLYQIDHLSLSVAASNCCTRGEGDRLGRFSAAREEMPLGRPVFNAVCAWNP